MVEHLLCKQGVNGSNPLGSTILPERVEDGDGYSRDEDTSFACSHAIIEGFALFFDIVNGFLIDAVMAGL